MKEKRAYKKPEIKSDKVKIGVFGSYGGNYQRPGGGWLSGWFKPRRRRR